MAFPPEFLDEVRARVPLADVVGKRMRLTRKGREAVGLCPFHREKTPSFTVFDDHYHCFGCGAHGSVFDFVMQSEGVSFPEAVERLAAEAGLEVPAEGPEERKRAARRRSLHEVTEAATVYFEKMLRMPEGSEALGYLRRRGLDDALIKRFRLGFAPNARGALKAALAREGFDEALMVEAGLLVAPEEPGRSPYDRFRGRVMFPIADRRGQVVAFGGRVLGSGEPKYLNSPETPLFHKGRLLYGLSLAAKAAREAGTMVVAEGYMDVIALVRAGFPHVVAPLGTALTGEQIGELWRLVPEPVLLFDPDPAGRRAAVRAAERVLPLIKPGYGLRFAFIETATGDDPDGVSRRYPPQFIASALSGALSLSEMIFWMETKGRVIRSAEDRAALERRLKERAMTIGDASLRTHFLNVFRERLWQAVRRGGRDRQGGDRRRPPAVLDPAAAKPTAASVERRQEEILLMVLLTHPQAFEEVGERLGHVQFSAVDLDNLRQHLLMTLTADPGLDSEALESHLRHCGYANTLDSMLSSRLFDHASFAKPGVELGMAVEGWKETFVIYRERHARGFEGKRRRLTDAWSAEDDDLRLGIGAPPTTNDERR